MMAVRKARARGDGFRMVDRAARDHMVMMARSDMAGFAALARWSVATVASGGEIAARDALAAEGIDSWLPVEKRRRTPRRGQGVKLVDRAVWPGYLFVRLLPCAQAWVGAMMAGGLTGWIGLDGEPALLPDRMVGDLQACEKTGDFAAAARKLGRPNTGDAVRMKGAEMVWIVARYHEARAEVSLFADAVAGRVTATVGLDELDICA